MAKVGINITQNEYYQNKEGLLKHQAAVEAGKTLQAMEIEYGELQVKHSRGGLQIIKL